MPNWDSTFVRGYAYVYSPNMGRIEKYVVDTAYEACLTVFCGVVPFFITQKSTYTRVKSCIMLEIKDDISDDKKTIEKENKEIEEQFALLRSFMFENRIEGSLYTTDPRIVRAYILMWYEVFKKTPVERINALLNESVDMTIPDAAEWLRRNEFRYSEEFKDFDSDPPNADYLYDPAALKDPYWLPKKKG